MDTLARGRRRSGAGDLADGEILRARDAGFSGGAPDGEYLAGRFHRPHGLRLCGGRPGRVAQRRRNGLGVVSGGQARVVRAFAQRGRGSPDEERPGAGGQGGCGGGARCRGPHAGDGAGDGAARQRGGIAQDERKPREAGATRRGGADRG